jgi:hypothetical protein
MKEGLILPSEIYVDTFRGHVPARPRGFGREPGARQEKTKGGHPRPRRGVPGPAGSRAQGAQRGQERAHRPAGRAGRVREHGAGEEREGQGEEPAQARQERGIAAVCERRLKTRAFKAPRRTRRTRRREKG